MGETLRESRAFNVKVGDAPGLSSQTTAIHYGDGGFRFCLENSGKAYLWNCFIRMILF